MPTDETEKRAESRLADVELKSSDAKEIVLPDGTKLQQAIASNPDQFPSMANLAIPGAENIEPFQIVDDGKLIAASRKVEPALDSFTAGLKALPEGATPEQLADYQINYIRRKADVIEAKEDNAVSPGALLQGYVEKTANEYWERAAGALIGTVQGVGNVAANLASIADFCAYCIIGDQERASEMGAEFGESVANTIFAGGQLFKLSYDYLYQVGFEGDYSKPFKDIASTAIILNDRWQQLPPREQERIKAELISQMVADGFVGMGAAKSLGKAKQFTELLDEIAVEAAKKTGQRSKKLIQTLGNHVNDLLQPEFEVVGVGKMKMRDFKTVTKEDLALKMEGKAQGKAHRGDDNFHSKLDEYGRPKSHINEQGDLVPADPKGIYDGKPVEVIDHVFGFSDTDVKQYSPYTSFSLESGVAIKYGNQKIMLNLESFRKAVKQGELLGTEIIEHEELIEIVKKSKNSEFNKWKALKFITEDQEILIKGTIPARFLEIGK
jgi:hypothetical protein